MKSHSLRPVARPGRRNPDGSPRRRSQRLAASLLLLGVGGLLGLAGHSKADAEQPGFEFALIGDYPYYERDYAGMPHLVSEIREDTALRFVIHLGDFHNPRFTDCSEAFFRERFEMLLGLGHPFVLTPGDNDWADCAGSAMEHLNSVRRVFFDDPARANGPSPFALRSQGSSSDFPEIVENAIWEREGVVFATLHMIAASPIPFLDETNEYRERLIAAGEAWLDEAFALATQRDAPAVFLATQVSLWPIGGSPFAMELLHPGLLDQSPAFAGFKAKLVRHVRAFGRPVVLANGDSHYFRIDKPLADASQEILATFTRVEGFGSPHGHWVRVRVDPGRPEVFSFRQELVEENLFTLVAREEREDDVEQPRFEGLRRLAAFIHASARVLMLVGAITLLLWLWRGIRWLVLKRSSRQRRP